MRPAASRLRMAAPIALAATALLAAAVTGCGGNDKEPARATPAATATVAESPYRTDVLALLDDLARAATRAGDALGSPNLDADGWRREAADALDQLGTFEVRARRLTPPPGLDATHRRLLAAADDLAQSASALRAAVASQDVARLEDAAERLPAVVAAVAALRAELGSTP